MVFPPLRSGNDLFDEGNKSDVFSAPDGRSENLILYVALTRYNTMEVKHK